MPFRAFRCLIAATLLGLALPGAALAQSCGNTGAGFEAWKVQFAQTARQAGVKAPGLQALAGARYATRTIAADRNQRSFGYTLEKFMQVRGANAIVSQGRQRKVRNAKFYAALEQYYGVPAGVLIAIHGMETGFGNFMGDSPIVSAITTLAYDCRRSAFFIPHAIGALKLVDRGTITGQTRGALHGELGHTQFLPGNALAYGVDIDRNGRVDFYAMGDALASTANFLKQKGWRKGRGYQPGEPNFAAIQAWNAAGVYQKTIAIMAARIDAP